MTDYVRHLIASSASRLLPIRGQRLRNRLARQLLPYCFVETDGGLLPLNRSYKPVGWPADLVGRVDYEDGQFDSLRIDWACCHPISAGLHNVKNADGSFWFLYGGPGLDPPWKSAGAGLAYTRLLGQVLGGRCTDAGVA